VYRSLLLIIARIGGAMTVGAAWIRRGESGEELWFASDSRLSGDGNLWDVCPKIMPLPRRDAIAAFSGSTTQAYPLILQIANTIGAHYPAADGSLEFFELLSHLQRVVNELLADLTQDENVKGESSSDEPFKGAGDSLVLGGYSRLQGHLVLRKLTYEGSSGRWMFHQVRPMRTFGNSRAICIFGDLKAMGRYRFLLKRLLEQRGTLERNEQFSFEPLETLVSMLRMPPSIQRPLPLDRRPATIGGAPQVVRVFPGSQETSVAVLWKPQESAVYLQGRRALEYENLDVPLVEFLDNGLNFYGPGRWPAAIIEARNSVVPSEKRLRARSPAEASPRVK
jgi:hypothetical protein